MDTSDQALDEAAGFQDGFRTYLPLYNDYTGSSLSLETDVRRPYDELREIDFVRLSGVWQRCARLGDGFEERLEDVNTQVATVDGWTGDAANAFRGYLQQFQTAAQRIDEDLEAIATATGDAVPAGQQVISAYVAAIGDIDFSGFDPPGDLQFMIDVERMLKPAGDVISAVTGWLGDLIGVVLPLPGGGGGLSGAVTGFVMDRIGDAVDSILDALGMSVDAFLEWIASKVREYLDASFKARFESNLQLLNDAVGAATAGISEAFQPIVDAAGAVTGSPFAVLPVPPEGDPGRPPAGSAPVPGGAVPGGAVPGGGSAGNDPAGAQPAGGSAAGTPGAGSPGGVQPGASGGAGDPEVVPAATATAGGGCAAAGPPVDGDIGPGARSGVISGGERPAMSGVVSGGPSYASGHPGGLPDGPVTTGAIGPGANGGSGAAQLATAADTGGGPGGAQLASVGDEPRGGQHGGLGVPMMPMSGTVTGGDQERRAGGSWQVPGEGVFDNDEPPAGIPGVLGGIR